MNDRSIISNSSRGVLVAELALIMPDPPGDSIAQLRATCPLVFDLPGDAVIDAPLAGVPGRTFRAAGTTLEIVKVAANPPGRRPGTAVEILFRSPDRKPPAQRTLTFHDAQGREVFVLPTAATEAGGAVRLTAESPVGVPARVRYVAFVRAAVNVTFDFADIPLP